MVGIYCPNSNVKKVKGEGETPFFYAKREKGQSKRKKLGWGAINIDSKTLVL
jgi:hypothetical protein